MNDDFVFRMEQDRGQYRNPRYATVGSFGYGHGGIERSRGHGTFRRRNGVQSYELSYGMERSRRYVRKAEPEGTIHPRLEFVRNLTRCEPHARQFAKRDESVSQQQHEHRLRRMTLGPRPYHLRRYRRGYRIGNGLSVLRRYFRQLDYQLGRVRRSRSSIQRCPSLLREELIS